MIATLFGAQHNDVYVSLDKPTPLHTSRSHMYSSGFGMTETDLSHALDALLSEEDNAPVHQRTFAYEVVRNCPHSDLSSWDIIASAVMRDFSSAEHLDHLLVSLEMFECLPNPILLRIATDPDVSGKMTSMLEHQAPEIRCAAARCLSGAWLRVWSCLVEGDLRRYPFDEDNVHEGTVRQQTFDEVVVVWKAIIALCASDDDDAVVGASFRAMSMLFDAGRGGNAEEDAAAMMTTTTTEHQQHKQQQPYALELALRVQSNGWTCLLVVIQSKELIGHSSSVINLWNGIVLLACHFQWNKSSH